MAVVGMKASQMTRFQRAHKAHPLPESDVFWPNVLMAIYGAGWCFTLPFVGQIFVAEVFALAVLPFVDPIGTLRAYPVLRKILVGYGVLLIGLMASDFVNETGVLDFLRGWANILFGTFALVFVSSCLRKNINSIIYFLVFTTLFKFLLGDASYALSKNIAFLSPDNPNYFKIMHVPYLLPAICLAGFYAQRFGRLYAALLFAVSAVVFVFFDARSNALALLAGALFITASVYKFQIKWSYLAIIALPMLAAGQLIYIIYVDYTLKNNPFGQSGTQMSQISDPYNPLLLLLQGRSEWTVAGVAIADKPFFGHGSWAVDYDRRYAALRAERTRSLDTFYMNFESESFLVPAHSVLLTGWLWAGLIGFFGVLLILKNIVRLVFCCYKSDAVMFSIIAVFIPLCLWDFFFSPIQVLRLSFPQYLGLMIALSIPQYLYDSGHANRKR